MYRKHIILEDNLEPPHNLNLLLKQNWRFLLYMLLCQNRKHMIFFFLKPAFTNSLLSRNPFLKKYSPCSDKNKHFLISPPNPLLTSHIHTNQFLTSTSTNFSPNLKLLSFNLTDINRVLTPVVNPCSTNQTFPF